MATKKPAPAVKKAAAKKPVAKKPAAKKVAPATKPAAPVKKLTMPKLPPNAGAGAKSLKVLADRVDTVSRGVTTFKLDPRIIQIREGFNGRPIDPAHVGNIKQARIDGAVFPPLVVEVDNGVVTLLDGHHRLTDIMGDIAAGKKIDTVVCMEFKGDAGERRALMIGSGLAKPLTPLQLGKQYKLLHSADGWSISKIAMRFGGKSEQHVRDMIELDNAEADVKQAIETGQVSATAALNVVKKEGRGAGEKIAKAVAASTTGKVTPKALKSVKDSAEAAADTYVKEAKERGKAAKLHLSALLDSPGVDKATKDAVGVVLKQMKVAVAPVVATPKAMELDGVMHWLEAMATNPQCRPTLREGAKWFYALMARPDLPATPPPAGSVDLAEAIIMEMNSGGSVTAETMCPENAGLIKYLRSTGEV